MNITSPFATTTLVDTAPGTCVLILLNGVLHVGLVVTWQNDKAVALISPHAFKEPEPLGMSGIVGSSIGRYAPMWALAGASILPSVEPKHLKLMPKVTAGALVQRKAGGYALVTRFDERSMRFFDVVTGAEHQASAEADLCFTTWTIRIPEPDGTLRTLCTVTA